MTPRRRPRNVAEGQLFDELTGEGWEVFKRGWPDYIAVRGDEVRIIEVKPNSRRRLKKDQAMVMQLLADHGLHVSLWTPDGGFTTFAGKTLGNHRGGTFKEGE